MPQQQDPSLMRTGVDIGGNSGLSLLPSIFGTADSVASAAKHASPLFGNQAAGSMAANVGNMGYMKGINGVLAPLGLVSGGLGMYDGISSIADGTFGNTDGGLVEGGDLIGNTLGAVSGAIGTAGLVGSGLTAAGGALGTGAVGTALSGAGSAVAGVAGGAAATAIGGVAAAGAGGWALGSLMADASDSDRTKTGFWGTDEHTGQNQSAQDWGASWGTTVDEWLGTEPGDWSVLGAGASMAGGIVGGIGGAAHAAGSAIGSFFSGW